MWLARNKDGKLFIWRIRPIKIGGKWDLGIENQCSAYIPNDDYPEVKWSDKEPRELVGTDKGRTAMITFEEFADAYASAVPKILAKMKYLERIGRDPFDENKPLPKWRHKANNLKERRKQNRSNKIPF